MYTFTSFKSKTDIFVSFQYNYPYQISTNRFERQKKMFDLRKAKIIMRIIIMIQKINGLVVVNRKCMYNIYNFILTLSELN